MYCIEVLILGLLFVFYVIIRLVIDGFVFYYDVLIMRVLDSRNIVL